MLLRPASRLRRAALARGLASSSAAAAAGGTPPPALLPVLDLALLAPAPAPAAARAAELARLRAALTSGGGAFSLRTASAVPPALVASAYAALSAFHSLPRDTKMRYHSSRDPRGRGWVPLYEEPVYSTEGEGGGGDADAPVVSHVTAFDLAHDTPAGSPLVGLPGVGPNVWPADESVPGFRDAAAGYYAATTAVARVLFAAAAECLGLQADAFLRLFNPPLARGTMRLLLYPGAASAAVAEARKCAGFGGGEADERVAGPPPLS